jgi:hypothetical protein
MNRNHRKQLTHKQVRAQFFAGLIMGLMCAAGVYKFIVWLNADAETRMDRYYYNNPSRGGLQDHE